jgi:hypothetical protein
MTNQPVFMILLAKSFVGEINGAINLDIVDYTRRRFDYC